MLAQSSANLEDECVANLVLPKASTKCWAIVGQNICQRVWSASADVARVLGPKSPAPKETLRQRCWAKLTLLNKCFHAGATEGNFRESLAIPLPNLAFPGAPPAYRERSLMLKWLPLPITLLFVLVV